MKKIILLIGIMMALVVCITPVAAVSGADFDIDIDNFGDIDTYKYYNLYTPGEKYICLHTQHTKWFCSLVTFKPANIPDAPVMVVHTGIMPGVKGYKYIYLSQSVDDWEIKYYSRWSCARPDDKYLKNAGVVNLKEHFGKYIEKGLFLEVKWGQWLHSVQRTSRYWCIPDVD